MRFGARPSEPGALPVPSHDSSCDTLQRSVLAASPSAGPLQPPPSCLTSHWLSRPPQLLALLCRPAEPQGCLSLPPNAAVWGIDSGVRHSVGGSDYGSVRVGAFMVRFSPFPARTAEFSCAPAEPPANGTPAAAGPPHPLPGASCGRQVRVLAHRAQSTRVRKACVHTRRRSSHLLEFRLHLYATHFSFLSALSTRF